MNEHVGLYYRYEHEHDEDWARRKLKLRVIQVLDWVMPCLLGGTAFVITNWIIR